MKISRLLWIALTVLLLPTALLAQGLTAPPSGDNQKASVTQHIGPVTVTINYSSPDVSAPDGTDRRGKVYGELVHWGFKDENFGTCTECPWRAGANENTTITFSHDVEVEGQPLAAGTYGLHMAAGPEEWTIIFSNNSGSWGSYFYESSEDALRVKVKPEKAEYRHWLTYDFHDRQPTQTSVRLWWEDLAVPFTITVPNLNDIYVEAMRNDLRGAAGFTWSNWVSAATFCLQNEINLEEAEQWASTAVNTPWMAGKNLRSLATLAQLQKANGKTEEALATAKEAMGMAIGDGQKQAVQGLIDSIQAEDSE
jgi:hypothetical protein